MPPERVTSLTTQEISTQTGVLHCACLGLTRVVAPGSDPVQARVPVLGAAPEYAPAPAPPKSHLPDMT